MSESQLDTNLLRDDWLRTSDRKVSGSNQRPFDHESGALTTELSSSPIAEGNYQRIAQGNVSRCSKMHNIYLLIVIP